MTRLRAGAPRPPRADRTRPLRAAGVTLAGLVVAALVLGGLVLGGPVLGGPGPAHAAPSGEPALSTSGLRQEPGLVEFFLSAQGLPAGGTVEPGSVRITAGGTPLTVRRAVQVATSGADARRRLAVLVLDTSGSMAGAPIAAARAAAVAYTAALPTDVDVAVVTVSTTARAALAPTPDRTQVRATLNGLTATGETALYDGIRIAASFGTGTAYTDRRMLVLSDGEDTTSRTPLAGVRRVLAGAAAPVDTVAFRTSARTRNVLAGFAAATGGRAYTAADAPALAGAFRNAAGAFGVQLLVTAEVPAALAGKQTRLDVTARAAGRDLRTSLPVTVAVDPSVVEPLAAVRADGPGLAVLAGIAVVVFLGLLVAGLLIFSPLMSGSRRSRLAQVDQFTAARPATAAAGAGESAVARAALALTEQVVKSRGLEGRLAQRLDRAGMRLRPHEWILVQALVTITGGLLGALLLPVLLGVPLGAAAGWAGTVAYQRLRADRRTRAFATLLPDALQLMIGSLRTGFSLSQAIDAMARELPDPISTEFGRALAETRLGVDLEDALERLADRMRSTDLAWAVVAVRVQREVGGNLAEVLETTMDTMRERDALRRHVRALSAEGRLSAWVLIALPVGVGAFMFLFRAEYLRPLYTEPLGILMLSGAVLLVGVGAFWLSRVVKVEV